MLTAGMEDRWPSRCRMLGANAGKGPYGSQNGMLALGAHRNCSLLPLRQCEPCRRCALRNWPALLRSVHAAVVLQVPVQSMSESPA